MIDHALRAQGCGASDIAKILGLSKWGDAFSVYASKTGLLPPAPSTDVQRRGHRFEQLILTWFGEVTGQKTEWYDTTVQHPTEKWMMCSPDGFILDEADRRISGCDAKTVHYSNHEDWGEDQSDVVPEDVSLQCAWTLAVLDMPEWSVAAMLSMDELRTYRIHRDMEIEAIIKEQVDHFWRHNVLARVPPRPGGSPATTEALKRMFKRDIEPLRCATAEEYPLIDRLKAAKAAKKKAELECSAAENCIRLAIGDAGGLLAGGEKITYRRCADTVGVSWQNVATELGLRLELLKPIVERALLDAMVKQSDAGQALIKLASESGAVAHAPDWWGQTLPQLAAQHQVVTKQGSRRLICPRAWAGEE